MGGGGASRPKGQCDKRVHFTEESRQDIYPKKTRHNNARQGDTTYERARQGKTRESQDNTSKKKSKTRQDQQDKTG